MSHHLSYFVFFLTQPPTTEIYTLSLHDALPIWEIVQIRVNSAEKQAFQAAADLDGKKLSEWIRDRLRRLSREELRSEEHTSELQSLRHLVCRLLLEKKKKKKTRKIRYTITIAEN